MDAAAVRLAEALEDYISGLSFPPIYRVECFFDSKSDQDKLIGGQSVEVVHQGKAHSLAFPGMFRRLVQYKVTAEKIGNGWNIVASPRVPNAKHRPS